MTECNGRGSGLMGGRECLSAEIVRAIDIYGRTRVVKISVLQGVGLHVLVMGA